VVGAEDEGHSVEEKNGFARGRVGFGGHRMRVYQWGKVAGQACQRKVE
jgi:hypothetical protein